MLQSADLTHAASERFRLEVRSLFGSRTFRLALGLMGIGLVLWLIRDTPTKPGEPSSPALLRLGAGFAGGFLIGFLFRRFVKTTALLGMGILGGIALLKSTGWLSWDWAAIEASVRHSLFWTEHQAEALKTLLTGYLPSAGATGFGLWKGFRRPTLPAASR